MFRSFRFSRRNANRPTEPECGAPIGSTGNPPLDLDVFGLLPLETSLPSSNRFAMEVYDRAKPDLDTMDQARSWWM